jgi:hypothetical protein
VKQSTAIKIFGTLASLLLIGFAFLIGFNSDTFIELTLLIVSITLITVFISWTARDINGK